MASKNVELKIIHVSQTYEYQRPFHTSPDIQKSKVCQKYCDFSLEYHNLYAYLHTGSSDLNCHS